MTKKGSTRTSLHRVGPVVALALLCLLAPTVVLQAQAPCPSCTIDVTLLATPKVSASHTDTGWSVEYWVDADSAPPGYTFLQTVYPRDVRGLALSPTGQFLYAGYNNSNPDGTMGEVRKIDTTNPNPLDQTAVVAFLIGFRGKAIAVDDKGRVYLAEGRHEENTNPVGPPDSNDRLVIYDSNLNTQLFNFPIAAVACPASTTYPGATANDNCLPQNARPEGVAVVRQGTSLVLWVSDRTRKTLDKFILSECAVPLGSSSPGICGATFAGEFIVPSAVDLRGVDVDPSGRIWIADASAGGGVFVVTWNSSTPSTSTSAFVTVPAALDVALDSANAFVTTDNQTFQIEVIDQTALTLGTPLTPPYAALDPPIDPAGLGLGHLSGIVVACPLYGCETPGFYVANEAGTTLDHVDREPIIRANAGTFTSCCRKVTGGGQIAIGTSGKANYGFNVQQPIGALKPKGQLEYLDHTTGANYHSVAMTTLTVSADFLTATFTGKIIRKGSTTTCTSANPCTFTVKVEDNGEPGRDDKFEITINDVYAQGLQKIARGNIQIHRKCN